MFANTEATIVDVSNLDTSNVTNMSRMFGIYNPSFGGKYSSNLTNIIGLEKLNTSKVTDMSYMFQYIIMPILDLSTFYISNVTEMTSMFGSATITTGYAKTQADADRFNAVSSSSIFIVK